MLLSSAVERGSFRSGFQAAAESLGSSIVSTEVYPAGTVNFRDEVRNLVARRVDLLLWDGDPREAESMLRELASQRVSMRICGGEGLAPNQHHAEIRPLLEGIQYVADGLAARRLHARPPRQPGARDRRGPFRLAPCPRLSGRPVVRACARGGALCPEEITAWLASTGGAASDPLRLEFLDVSREGATLPIYVVRRGRGVPALQ